MGDYNFTLAELTSQIKKEGKMNIAHLGDSTDQDMFIWYYITEAMWEHAGDIQKKKTTDALVVAANGYVQFQISGNNIEDLYAPLRIFVTSVDGKTLTPRTSFEVGNGWFKESANDPIHIRGAGTYILQYIAYPAKATTASQILDIPQTSYGLIKYKAIALIKESLNDLEGARVAYELATNKVPTLMRANKDATGRR
jgi:hypothetical protein